MITDKYYFCLCQLFSSNVKDFHTYRDSFLSTFCFRWLKITGRELRDITGPTGFRLGMLWSILYTGYWYILALNVFRVVLMDGWTDRITTKTKSAWNFLWKSYFKSKNKVCMFFRSYSTVEMVFGQSISQSVTSLTKIPYIISQNFLFMEQTEARSSTKYIFSLSCEFYCFF